MMLTMGTNNKIGKRGKGSVWFSLDKMRISFRVESNIPLTGLSSLNILLIPCSISMQQTEYEWCMKQRWRSALNAVHRIFHTAMFTTTFVELLLTSLLVVDDVFAEQVIVTENYRGTQHRQALLEPNQLFSQAPWAGHLPPQPGGSRESNMMNNVQCTKER